VKANMKMKKVAKKIVSLVLGLVMVMGLAVPVMAEIGNRYGDTSSHVGFMESLSHNIFVNNRNELVLLSFSDTGQPVIEVLMEGVKEVAAGLMGVHVVLTTDGRLIIWNRIIQPAFELDRMVTVAVDGVEIDNAISIVYQNIFWPGVDTVHAIPTRRIIFINDRNELVSWERGNFSGRHPGTGEHDINVDILDTNVRVGTSGVGTRLHYIKHDNSLWRIDVPSLAAPQDDIEHVLNDVVWFADSMRTGEVGTTFFVIRTDGSLWGWGNNSSGEVGVLTLNYLTVTEGFFRHGRHMSVNEPVRILDNVDRIFVERTSIDRTQTTANYLATTVHAVLRNGTVVSWGGELLERNPNAWQHRQQPENQRLANVGRLFTESPFIAPFTLTQYNDGRLVFAELGEFHHKD